MPVFKPITTNNTRGILPPVIAALCFALWGIMFIPFQTHAAFVPVIDQLLSVNGGKFDQYRTAFDAYALNMDQILQDNPDSIRNIISSGNFDQANCISRAQNPNMAPATAAIFPFYAKDNQFLAPANTQELYYLPNPVTGAAGEPSQYQLIDPITGGVVATPQNWVYNTAGFPVTANTNGGTSLRCLLMELIEWKKLEINMTMHQMAKEYFTDAATFVLSKRLNNALAGYQIGFANKGLLQPVGPDAGGNMQLARTSSYVANREEQKLLTSNNQVEGLLFEITHDGSNPNVANLQIPDPFKNAVRNNVEANTRGLVIRPQDLIAAHTSDKLSNVIGNVNDIDKFYSNLSDPSLTVPPTQALLVSNEQNVVAYSLQLLGRAQDAVARERSDQEATMAESGGNLPIVQPSDGDPFARTTIVNSPAFMQNEYSSNSGQTGTRALDGADEYAEWPTNSAINVQGAIGNSGGGMRFYNPQILINPNGQKALHDYYNEFDFQISSRYFDLDTETRNWARNSLLPIWDGVQITSDVEQVFYNLAEFEKTVPSS